MSTRSPSRIFPRIRTLAATLLVFGLVAATSAIAGLGGSVVPSFPSPLNEGDIKTATISITNRATAPNDAENVNVTGILFTPSCAASNGYACSTPDTGVFQFATVVGKVGSSCANTVFTMGASNPASGEFELIPPAGKPVVLGPSNGVSTLPKTCVISINFKVLRTPRDSTPGDATVTTYSLARASLQGASSGSAGAASGGGLTTFGEGPRTILPPLNVAPVANAGSDRAGQTQNALSFSGSGSSDPDGTIVSYNWNFGDGSAGSGVNVSHAYATAGTYTATLSVTDNSGATASDSVVVTVTANSGPATGAYRWGKQLGGAGSTAVSYSTAVDPSGNVVIAGAFWGTVNLGGASLTSAGGSDIFVAKYSATGAHIWSKRFGGTNDDTAQAVAVDPSGNVVLTGSFKGTVNFGGGALSAYYSGFGAATTDAFVAMLSSSGAHVWSKSFGSFGNDTAYSVATDGSGNVIVAGTFYGHVDVSGTMLVSTNDSADMFLAKYAPGGTLVWVNRFGDGGTDNAYGVAVDYLGNMILTGTFSGTVDFGGGRLTSAGSSSDVALVKLSPAGQHVWSKRFGDTGQDVGYAVATDPNGNVAITGYFQGNVNFGGGLVSSHGSLDTFVAKYSATGTHLWSFGLGGTNADEGFDIAMDQGGNVVIAGTFQGTTDFGTGPLTSAGSWDVVVAKYSAGGTPLWSKRIGGTGDDLAYSVAIDGAGNATVAGYFQGTVNLGGGAMTASGDRDAFLVNLAP